MSNKELTIHLKIQTLRIPVTERLPVIIIWSRQQKQAKTSKRLLTQDVNTAVFDQEFQISTTIQCDEEGNPVKSKMSNLTVASDKAHGILGKCDLDLSAFSYDDFKVQKITVRECAYEDAWIEVGLKAVPANRQSSRNLANQLGLSQKSGVAGSAANESMSSDANMTEAHYRELLEQFTEMKKTKRAGDIERNKEVQQLQSRNNQLQTDYENAKVTTAGANKKVKEAQEEVTNVEEQIEEQQKILVVKTAENETSMHSITERDATIESHKNDIHSKEEELVNTGKLMEDATKETELAKQDVDDLFNIERFDTNFLGDIISLLKKKPVDSSTPKRATRQGTNTNRLSGGRK